MLSGDVHSECSDIFRANIQPGILIPKMGDWYWLDVSMCLYHHGPYSDGL